MKKNSFVMLVVLTVLGLMFSVGLCMCLLPEWDLFGLGLVLSIGGGTGLLIIAVVKILEVVKRIKPINYKFVSKITYLIVSILTLGVAMSMILVWELIIAGIIVGIVAILMLLFSIPIFRGFKE